MAIVALLLSILVPLLNSARQASYLETCAANQRRIGVAWRSYMDDHNQHFPFLVSQPQWRYGGVRFNVASGNARLDEDRPLNEYIDDGAEATFFCPADSGVVSELADVGTGERTAFRSFGSSYRANAMLIDARTTGLSDEHRPVNRGEIVTPPAQQVVLGDAGWYEAWEQTGRSAHWHDAGDAHEVGCPCNLLFLDGSVRFRVVQPKSVVGPVVFKPALRQIKPQKPID